MTVEQTEVINIIGVERALGRVVLTVTDHLSFEEESEHLRLLQEKLNSYLAFIESGELLDAYPEAHSLKAVSALSSSMSYQLKQRFLEEAKQPIVEAGLALVGRIYAEAEEENT